LLQKLQVTGLVTAVADYAALAHLTKLILFMNCVTQKCLGEK